MATIVNKQKDDLKKVGTTELTSNDLEQAAGGEHLSRRMFLFR